jgi:hypothetical protein
MHAYIHAHIHTFRRSPTHPPTHHTNCQQLSEILTPTHCSHRTFLIPSLLSVVRAESSCHQKDDTVVEVAKYAPDLPKDFEGATKLALMPPYLAVKATSATLPSRMNLLGNQDFYVTAAWNAECVFF